MQDSDQRILVTGASGYVGGLLLPRLSAGRRRVRAMVRRPGEFRRPGVPEVVRGDVLDLDSLRAALQGVGAAYYLVHSMGEGRRYVQNDRVGAANFARAARENRVKKIVYLGGLGSGGTLSAHLKSRQEVGRILRESGIDTVEFRAAVVIGRGSLSFDMISALVERLPVMVTPRWVRTPTQPIAAEDLLDYLAAALEENSPRAGIFEIGGADRTSYLGMMKEYARLRGLKLVFIPVPVLSPGLSSLWLKLVTPLHAGVGRELIEGVRNPTLVKDPAAFSAFAVRPMGHRAALTRALGMRTPSRRDSSA